MQICKVCVLISALSVVSFCPHLAPKVHVTLSPLSSPFLSAMISSPPTILVRRISRASYFLLLFLFPSFPDTKSWLTSLSLPFSLPVPLFFPPPPPPNRRKQNFAPREKNGINLIGEKSREGEENFRVETFFLLFWLSLFFWRHLSIMPRRKRQRRFYFCGQKRKKDGGVRVKEMEIYSAAKWRYSFSFPPPPFSPMKAP